MIEQHERNQQHLAHIEAQLRKRSSIDGYTQMYRLLALPDATVIILTADTWVKCYHHIYNMRSAYTFYDPVRARIECRFSTKEMVKLLCTREYISMQLDLLCGWFSRLRSGQRG